MLHKPSFLRFYLGWGDVRDEIAAVADVDSNTDKSIIVKFKYSIPFVCGRCSKNLCLYINRKMCFTCPMMYRLHILRPMVQIILQYFPLRVLSILQNVRRVLIHIQIRFHREPA